MSAIIRWSKRYFEELGELDNNGCYEYAYRYFVYTFYLPDKYSVVVRNYTDTILEASLFIYKNKEFNKESTIDTEPLVAVLDFLCTKYRIVHFTHFDGEYKSVEFNRLKSRLIDFSFVEIAAIE